MAERYTSVGANSNGGRIVLHAGEKLVDRVCQGRQISCDSSHRAWIAQRRSSARDSGFKDARVWMTIGDDTRRGFGAFAVITGVLKWKFQGRDLQRHHSTIAVKRGAEWKILAQQVTPSA